uniref:Uncharacterized protein n=1 Tax=Arundo donax TaxID=35708 RepID=A0A0A9BZ80_ARUDO
MVSSSRSRSARA